MVSTLGVTENNESNTDRISLEFFFQYLPFNYLTAYLLCRIKLIILGVSTTCKWLSSFIMFSFGKTNLLDSQNYLININKQPKWLQKFEKLIVAQLVKKLPVIYVTCD
jgi:hypothetical protein